MLSLKRQLKRVWEVKLTDEKKSSSGRDSRRRPRPWFAGKACVGPRPRRGGSPPAGCTGSHLSQTSSPCEYPTHTLAVQWKPCTAHLELSIKGLLAHCTLTLSAVLHYFPFCCVFIRCVLECWAFFPFNERLKKVTNWPQAHMSTGFP